MPILVYHVMEDINQRMFEYFTVFVLIVFRYCFKVYANGSIPVLLQVFTTLCRIRQYSVIHSHVLLVPLTIQLQFMMGKEGWFAVLRLCGQHCQCRFQRGYMA